MLRGQLGREPTAAELAEGLGVNAEELASLRGSSEPLRFEPIDAVYSDHDPAFADERLDSHDILETQELRAALAGAVADLPERLQLVMQLYFVEELNLAEIAATLDVSVPRVHQLKAQALERLRAALGGGWISSSLRVGGPCCNMSACPLVKPALCAIEPSVPRSIPTSWKRSTLSVAAASWHRVNR